MPLSPQITITPVDITTKNFDISAVSYTSTTATYTATGHTFSAGDIVLVSDLAPEGYNGTFTITGVATNTFTVANTTNAAVTDAVGNAFWTDPTEYEYVNQDAVFLTDNYDLTEPYVNPALVQAQQALADAATAYTAAKASLQPSASTIVNASNQMTAISTNGITVYSGSSSSSGARVVMNSLGIAGYNAGGTATFAIDATTGAASFAGSITGSTITGSSLNINGNFIVDGTGLMTATGASVTGKLYSSEGTIGGFKLGTNYISTDSGSAGFRINTSGGAWFDTLNISSTATIGTGLVLTTGTCTVSAGGNTFNNVGAINVPSGNITTISGTINSGGQLNANSELYASQAVSASTTAATNCYITSGGLIRKTSTTSSARYKENITDIFNVPELDPKALLSLPVRAFTYKEGHIPETDDRYGQMLPGFIAEEVDAVYPIATDYQNGVETWNSFYIVPALLALIQDQEKRIAALEGK